ncbi:hypothetical protein [Phaeovulum vinaykumarii]|uniref:DUF4177 domain-containing protein n=1 Tax=Phaeovulum vinaykumarii TaxID=407234 RepID=A0A1N7JJY6_9RHOB|nr:hypothetical protein [Phaeovulum vinaykumarii]SIS49638.1 hypothetical protein SAMN05421795_10175 [Phaeovulum vinaykumarii]SOB89810.1 hypothetical protein SAMN05878426_10175 [Phaeovulum vinaykumarii]
MQHDPRMEYRVIPAPRQGERARGVRTGAGRFAHALESLMNEMAAEGWHYLRADTLPCDERSGLTRRTTVFHAMLVFARPRSAAAAQPEAAEARSDTPAPLAETAAEAPAPAVSSPAPSAVKATTRLHPFSARSAGDGSPRLGPAHRD